MTTKKLSEETEQKIVNPNPIELILIDLSVRVHSHIHVATRNVQWTFIGGYINYMLYTEAFVCGNLK